MQEEAAVRFDLVFDELSRSPPHDAAARLLDLSQRAPQNTCKNPNDDIHRAEDKMQRREDEQCVAHDAQHPKATTESLSLSPLIDGTLPTVLVFKTPYQRGPLSVFALGLADDKSRFAQGFNLPRQSFRPKVTDRSMSRIDRVGATTAAGNQLDQFQRTMLVLALLGTTAFGAAYYAVRAQPRVHKKRHVGTPAAPRLDGDVHTVTNIRTRPHDRDGAGHEIGAPPTRLLPWDVGTLDPLAGLPAPQGLVLPPVVPSSSFNFDAEVISDDSSDLDM
ncbi:hypothetical protein T492DRAFT_857827 [Pavlovales sp. CCMP2436]|nr:hypothetical protein T492DRAFT_857827 [Pavlovales sp. CCMP2436]